MRAVVYRGANDLRVETVPVPRIGARELLVRVAVCGVCPTDVKKIQHATLPPPRIFGHETAGFIARIGACVRGFRLGDRVALYHHVPCLECQACRHRAFAQCAQYKRTGVTAGFEPAGGGYAEYARVMPFALPGVVNVPSRNSLEEAAMLEPVNTVLKAVNRLRLLKGDSVLVVGQGPIGLMFTRLLRIAGMRVVATDLLEPRLALARRWGASWTFRADSPELSARLEDLTRGRGPDAAVVTAPSDTAVRQAHQLVRGAGQVLVFAHTQHGHHAQIDLAAVCVAEKDLIGSYSSDFTLQQEVARLVFSRAVAVESLITHRFPLERTAAAIALAAHPLLESLKILVFNELHDKDARAMRGANRPAAAARRAFGTGRNR